MIDEKADKSKEKRNEDEPEREAQEKQRAGTDEAEERDDARALEEHFYFPGHHGWHGSPLVAMVVDHDERDLEEHDEECHRDAEIASDQDESDRADQKLVRKRIVHDAPVGNLLFRTRKRAVERVGKSRDDEKNAAGSEKMRMRRRIHEEAIGNEGHEQEAESGDLVWRDFRREEFEPCRGKDAIDEGRLRRGVPVYMLDLQGHELHEEHLAVLALLILVDDLVGQLAGKGLGLFLECLFLFERRFLFHGCVPGCRPIPFRP